MLVITFVYVFIFSLKIKLSKYFVGPLWENAIDRVPLLKNARNPVLTNSPDNFTPNGKWILGETPEVNGLYVIKAVLKQS